MKTELSTTKRNKTERCRLCNQPLTKLEIKENRRLKRMVNGGFCVLCQRLENTAKAKVDENKTRKNKYSSDYPVGRMLEPFDLWSQR